MSAIYGLFTDKAEIIKNKKEWLATSLEKWNVAYGEVSGNQVFDNAIIGACIDNISELVPQGMPSYKLGDCTYFIDALIYNRDELGLEDCDGLSDEEFLSCYISKKGMASINVVNGDFAGAIYSEKDNSLTLFRDHMGVRPLFVYKKDSIVAFSTDIRSLVQCDLLDSTPSAEWTYRSGLGYGYADIDSTEFEYIRCLKPGSFVTFSFDASKKENAIEIDENLYFKLASNKIIYKTDEEYFARLRELITDAIRRRLAKTDLPVGSELSGGLDSSVIAILINRLGHECFHHSWSRSPELINYVEKDERLVIKDICDQENFDCHFAKEKNNLEELPKFVENMAKIGYTNLLLEDGTKNFMFPPYVDTVSISETSDYLRSKGVKMVFTGHGGDEGVSHRSGPFELYNYGEYGHFINYYWNECKDEKLRLVHTLWRAYKNITYMKNDVLKTNGTYFDGEAELFTKKFKDECRSCKLDRHTFGYDPVNYVNKCGSRYRLDNLALQGAYNGVRYVIPYLDYRVIDFALSIPRYMFLRSGEDRFIFRETFKDIMPESLYNVNWKMDFSMLEPPSDAKKSEEEYKDIDVAAEVKKSRHSLIDMLNRDTWESMIDFNFLDAWAEKPSTEADEDMDFGIVQFLSGLISIDKLRK